MKKFALAATLAVFCFSVEKGWSQTVWPTCGHDAVLQHLLFENPVFEQKQADFEDFYLEKMSHLKPASGQRAIVTVPVVFHVVHQNGPENLSDAQIFQALAHLNEAFSNSGDYAGGLGAAVEIQFCLATQKPDATPTTGIVRVASPLTDVDYPADDLPLKNLSRFDPTRYINIWIVRAITAGVNAGVAGYAFLPFAHGDQEDGIVMEADFVGKTSAGDAGFAHEMGHYFGLRHTFEGGCANSNCLTQGDRVCDTPPDNSTSWAPCGGPFPNTCATDAASGSPFSTDQPDMISNFMDYGDWSCHQDFTAGQAERMRFSLENVRKSLLASTGCQPPCPTAVSASFSAPTAATAGETVFFESQTTGAASFEWRIDGQLVSTAANFSHVFSAAGLFSVELKATGPNGCATAFFSKTIDVDCPTVAAFLASDATILAVGDSIFFKNTSIGAASFSWSIGGQTVSTASDFAFSSAAAGSFLVCLEAKNGLCSAKKCQILEVFDPSQPCEPTVVRSLGTLAATAGATARGAGNVIWHIGGAFSIQKIGPTGAVQKIWSLPNLPFPSGIFSRAIIDSDGHFVAVGQYGGYGFALRFDTLNEKMVWFQRISAFEQNMISDVVEREKGGPFVVSATAISQTGASDWSQPSSLFELARATGEVSPSFDFEYKNAKGAQFRRILKVGADFFAFGAANVATGNVARPRVLLTKIDSSGAVVFSKTWLIDPSVPAHFVGTDLAADSTGLYGLVQGHATAFQVAGPSFWVLKMGFDGALIWAKELSALVGSPTFWPQDLRLTDDGILVAGVATDAFLMKISKNGEKIEWATTISGTRKTASPVLSGRLQTDETSHFLIADAKLPTEGAFFLRTDRPGKVETGCATTVHGIDNILIADLPSPVWEVAGVFRSTGQTLFETPPPDATAIANGPFLPQKCPFCERKCIEDAPNVPPATCSQPTFARTFDLPTSDLFLIRTADSALIFNSISIHVAQKTTLSGDHVWLRTTGGDDTPVTVGFLRPTRDSGFLGTEPYLSQKRTVKFDKNGRIEWIQEPNINFADPFQEIIAPASDGSSALLMSLYGLGKTALIFQKFDEKGDTVWRKHFNEDSSSFVFHHLLELKNGDWLATGEVSGNVSGCIAARFSPTGELLWAKNFWMQGSSVWFAAELDDGSLVFPASSLFEKVLLKTTADGQLIFSKSIDFQWLNSGAVTGFEKTKTGIGLLISPSGGGAYLSKFDFDGQHVWSREFSKKISRMVALPKTEQFALLGEDGDCEKDVLLLRVDSLGRSGGCDFSTSVVPIMADVPLFFEDVLLKNSSFNIRFSKSQHGPPSDGVATSRLLCQSFCAPVCSVDLAVRLDSLACRDGSGSAFLTVCNESDSTFSGDVRLLFFEKEPTQNAQNALAADSFFVQLAAGECLDFEIGGLEKSLKNGPIWAFLNEKASFLDVSKFQKIDSATALKNECRRSNNFSKTDFSRPAPPVFDLGPDRVFCGQRPVELRGPSGFFRYKWSDGSADSTLSATSAGLFSLTVTDECGLSFSDSVRVRLDSATVLDLPDLLICRPTEVAVEGDFSKFSWSPSAGLACADCAKTTVDPPADGPKKYLVVAETADGCLAADTFRVTRGEARFPNSFTPDGDGLNDFFDVFTPENCPCEVVSMRILSRWGQLIFEKTSFESGEKTGWDGNFEGKPAPPDVYIFQIELRFSDQIRILETGDLTLLR